MRASKTRRVSWPADSNLCQVRLFLNDEAPSQVGLGIQDNIQAKTLSHLHGATSSSEDNLPPGFEGVQHTNVSNNLVLEIPTIKWTHPPKLRMNDAWQVVAGEESKEVVSENHRGLRVFEAIYPRPSSIPPNAVVSVEVTETRNDHQLPPVIPITQIVEEDVVVDLDPSNDLVAPAQLGSQCLVATSESISTPVYGAHNTAIASSSDRAVTVSAPAVEPGVIEAASEAYNAIMKSSELGNMIDPELLVQILSNRNLVEKLTNGYASNSVQAPQQNITPVHHSDPLPAHIIRPASAVALSSPNGPFYSQMSNILQPHARGSYSAPIPPHIPGTHSAPIPTHIPGTHSAPIPPTPPSRDLNYYKSLIQQHGEDRQEGQPTPPQFGPRPTSYYGMNHDQLRNNNLQRRDSSKAKILKPCMFFNTPRGCKNGSNCQFQHDASFQPRSMPDAKRMKMDREITGA